MNEPIFNRDVLRAGMGISRRANAPISKAILLATGKRDTMTVAACTALREQCPGNRLFHNPKETLLTEAMRYGFGSLGWLALVIYLALK